MNAPLTDKSSHLRLRALEPLHVDFLFEAENDTSAWGNSDTTAPLSRTMLRDYALNYDADPFKAGQLRLIVALPDDTPVGIADLYEISPLNRNAWVAIYISSSFRRCGFALEALRLLADYAADVLLLTNLAAKVAADNFASRELFLKAGYQLSGSLKNWIARKNNRFSDMLILTHGLSQ